MPITRNLADAIIRQQQQSLSLRGIGSQQRGRTVLGGSSGSGGGSGGPPGGLVGKLIQTRVCYDTTEAASSSGDSSLLDNLNHIRYDIDAINTSGSFVRNSSGSSTDNAIARFDGTSGSRVQNSGVLVDDSNNVSGIAGLTTGAGTKCDGWITRSAAEVQTSGSTQTALDNITLLDENTYHMKAYVVGVESSGSQRGSYDLVATAYRTGGGGATLQGTPTVLHAAESDANWDATFTVSGNDARISVTGVNATTIEWGGILSYMNMSN